MMNSYQIARFSALLCTNAELLNKCRKQLVVLSKLKFEENGTKDEKMTREDKCLVFSTVLFKFSNILTSTIQYATA